MRPNFLFIITDQQRADHLSVAGETLLSTPHIDSIAARGVMFDRFYVATPICMPNRSTLMTGRMPSVHGVRHNGIPLSLGATTFVEMLREAGYRTGMVGKSHLQNMVGEPPLFPGAELRPAHSWVSGRYDQEDCKKWRADARYDVDAPFYGFSTVDFCNEHSDATEGHYTWWLRARHPDPDSLRGPKNAIPTPDYVCPQAWRTRVPEELYSTSYVAERTIARLEENARTPDQPFFLKCSFPDPHHPWTPPGKYWGMHPPGEVRLKPDWNIDPAKMPPHVRWLLDRRDDGTAVKNTQALFAVNEREAREATALTFDMIKMIDDAIGRILAALRSSGQDRNTIVIFTADHADYMGSHQLMLKGPIHYQSLIRVPFLWADPLAALSGRRAALASTLDIAQTVLERAGVPAFYGMQGRSLMPVISGEKPKVRDALVIEEEGQRLIMGFKHRPKTRTLLTERHRLSIYAGVDWAELYDLENDPHELENLDGQVGARALRAELHERLAHEMLALTDPNPAPTGRA